MVRTAQNKIFIFREGEKVQIEAYGEHIIRVRASKGEIEDLNWTLLPPKEDRASVSEEGDNVVLENGGIRAVVSSDGKIAFKNQAGEVLFEELWRNERDIDARVIRGHVGGSSHIELHLRQYAGEHFYGLGQEAHDLFDLKGATLDLCQQNTKSTIPFVMSSRGYGFIWNNPAIGRVEFGTSGTRWVAESARQMDYLVIAGDTPGEIEHRYCEVTGYAPEFPEWATGLWQSKLRYETQDELMEVAREYKRRGITPSIIVCDYFHWPQQGEWKFDKKYWPEPEKMVKELNEMGIHLLVSIWPTVDPRSENFIEMRDQNMLIRSERGPGTLMYCRGPETYYDPTNPEARKFVWNGSADLSNEFAFLYTVTLLLTPILTMRLMSEDKKQKTEQALFSAPVTSGAIVAGKYFSAFVVYLAGVAVTLLHTVFLAPYAKINWMIIIGNFVGIALMGLAGIALCMYISAQTENQIVAAVGGLAAMLLVISLNSLAGVIPFGPVQKALYAISFYSRYHNLTLGIFKVSDLFFFISFAAVFFFLTTRVLEKRRWSGK